jgi:hypothetical protein
MRRKLLRRTRRQKGELSLKDLENIERCASSAFRELQEAVHFEWVIPNHNGEDSDNWEAFYYPKGAAGVHGPPRRPRPPLRREVGGRVAGLIVLNCYIQLRHFKPHAALFPQLGPCSPFRPFAFHLNVQQDGASPVHNNGSPNACPN